MRRAVREDEMEDLQDLDAATEAEGRRLLAAAFETLPADGALAGDGLARAELLRRVRRRTSRQRRVRTLVPAGAVAALGGAAALAVTLTATVASAPSALAAVTAAAAKTSAESFRFTSSETEVTSPATPQYNNPPFRFTGVFDPRHGLGEESIAQDRILILFVGGHTYSSLPPGEEFAPGKHWEEFPVEPPRPGVGPLTGIGNPSGEPTDPDTLLGSLKSAGSVQAEGPASGPGWTGTKYAFTLRPVKGATVSQTVRGTVYVDNQGRVRRLVTTDTWPMWFSNGAKGTTTATSDVTFGGFGVRVSVTAPPASQVYVVPLHPRR
jgi:hypothetical protein